MASPIQSLANNIELSEGPIHDVVDNIYFEPDSGMQSEIREAAPILAPVVSKRLSHSPKNSSIDKENSVLMSDALLPKRLSLNNASNMMSPADKSSQSLKPRASPIVTVAATSRTPLRTLASAASTSTPSSATKAALRSTPSSGIKLASSLAAASPSASPARHARPEFFEALPSPATSSTLLCSSSSPSSSASISVDAFMSSPLNFQALTADINFSPEGPSSESSALTKLDPADGVRSINLFSPEKKAASGHSMLLQSGSMMSPAFASPQQSMTVVPKCTPASPAVQSSLSNTFFSPMQQLAASIKSAASEQLLAPPCTPASPFAASQSSTSVCSPNTIASALTQQLAASSSSASSPMVSACTAPPCTPLTPMSLSNASLAASLPVISLEASLAKLADSQSPAPQMQLAAATVSPSTACLLASPVASSISSSLKLSPFAALSSSASDASCLMSPPAQSTVTDAAAMFSPPSLMSSARTPYPTPGQGILAAAANVLDQSGLQSALASIQSSMSPAPVTDLVVESDMFSPQKMNLTSDMGKAVTPAKLLAQLQHPAPSSAVASSSAFFMSPVRVSAITSTIDAEMNTSLTQSGCDTCADWQTQLSRAEMDLTRVQDELSQSQEEMMRLVQELEQLRVVLSERDDEIINFREDLITYQERYSVIESEGKKLYDMYEVKCIRVREMAKKVSELTKMCQTLESENTSLREKCEKYVAAYEEAEQRSAELELELSEARNEAAMAAKRAHQAANNVSARRSLCVQPPQEDDEDDEDASSGFDSEFKPAEELQFAFGTLKTPKAADVAADQELQKLRDEVQKWQDQYDVVSQELLTANEQCAQAQEDCLELKSMGNRWMHDAETLRSEVAHLKQCLNEQEQTLTEQFQQQFEEQQQSLKEDFQEQYQLALKEEREKFEAELQQHVEDLQHQMDEQIKEQAVLIEQELREKFSAESASSEVVVQLQLELRELERELIETREQNSMLIQQNAELDAPIIQLLLHIYPPMEEDEFDPLSKASELEAHMFEMNQRLAAKDQELDAYHQEISSFQHENATFQQEVSRLQTSLSAKDRELSMLRQQLSSVQNELSTKVAELSSSQSSSSNHNSSDFNRADAAKLITMPAADLSASDLLSHLESALISNELLRAENATLHESRRQVQQLQSKAQMTDGYVLMINKLRAEVAEAQTQAEQARQLRVDEYETALNERDAVIEAGKSQVVELQQIIAENEARMEEMQAQLEQAQSQFAQFQQREQESATSLASLDSQLKNAQNDLRLMYRRHQTEMADLKKELSQEDLRAKYASAMSSCVSMREQVDKAVRLLDVTFASELPLSEALGDEIKQIFTALKEQRDLLAQQQEQQRAEVRMAQKVVEHVQTENDKLTRQNESLTAAADESRKEVSEVSLKLRAAIMDGEQLRIQMSELREEHQRAVDGLNLSHAEECSKWASEMEQLEQTVADNEHLISELKNQIEELQVKAQQAHTELMVSQHAIKMCADERLDMERQIQSLSSKLEAAESQINGLNDDINGVQDELTQLQTEKADVDEQLSNAQAECERLQYSLNAEQETHTETTASLMSTQKELDDTSRALSETQEQLSEAQSTVEKLQSELQGERETVQSLQNRVEDLTQQVESQDMLLEQTKSERDDLKASMEEERMIANEVQNEMQADLEAAQNAQRDTDQLLRQTQQELTTLQEECSQLRETLASEQSQRSAEQEDAQRVELELREQISSLHEQLSDTAEKLAELHMIHNEQTQLLETSRDQAAATEMRMQAEIETLQEELNITQTNLSEVQSELSVRNAEHIRFVEESDVSRQAAADAMALLRSQMDSAEFEHQSTLSELSSARQEIAAAKRSAKQAADAIVEARDERDELLAKISDLESARLRAKDDSNSRADFLQQQLDRLEDEKRSLKEEIATLEGHLSAADASRKKLMADAAQLSVGKMQFNDMQHALDKAQKQLAAADEKHSRAVKELEDRHASVLAQVQEQRIAAERQLVAAEKSLATARADHQRLQTLLEQEKEERESEREILSNVASSSSSSPIEQAELSLLRQEVASLKSTIRRLETEAVANAAVIAESDLTRRQLERERQEIATLRANNFVLEKELNVARASATAPSSSAFKTVGEEIEHLKKVAAEINKKYAAKKETEADLRNKAYSWFVKAFSLVRTSDDAATDCTAVIAAEDLLRLCVGILKAPAPESADNARLQSKIDKVTAYYEQQQQKARGSSSSSSRSSSGSLPADSAETAPSTSSASSETIAASSSSSSAPAPAVAVKPVMSVVKMSIPTASSSTNHNAASAAARPATSAPIKFNLVSMNHSTSSASSSVPSASSSAASSAEAAAPASASAASGAPGRRMSLMERRQSLAATNLLPHSSS